MYIEGLIRHIVFGNGWSSKSVKWQMNKADWKIFVISSKGEINIFVTDSEKCDNRTLFVEYAMWSADAVHPGQRSRVSHKWLLTCSNKLLLTVLNPCKRRGDQDELVTNCQHNSLQWLIYFLMNWNLGRQGIPFSPQRCHEPTWDEW